jgi:hypothetical protein
MTCPARVCPGVSAGALDTLAETPPPGRLTPQVSGEIDPARRGPESMSEKPASEARLRVFICHDAGPPSRYRGVARARTAGTKTASTLWRSARLPTAIRWTLEGSTGR